MKTIRNFLTHLFQSATSFSYYSSLLIRPFSKALLSLSGLLLIVLLLSTIKLSIQLAMYIPKTPEFAKKATAVLQKLYPKDLIVTINNGVLRTNVDEPYVINLPEEANIQLPKKNFVIIDTKASASDINTLNTLILVTKSAIVYPSSNQSGYAMQLFSDSKNYVQFSRDQYNKIISPILPVFQYLPHIIGGIIFFLLLMTPLVILPLSIFEKLITILFFTSILYLITRFMRKELTFKQLFKLSMYGLTLPILVETGAVLLNASFPQFAFTSIFFLFMIIMLVKLPKETTDVLKAK